MASSEPRRERKVKVLVSLPLTTAMVLEDVALEEDKDQSLVIDEILRERFAGRMATRTLARVS